MPLKVRFLKALHGDAIFITAIDEDGVSTILIDGGPPSAFTPREVGDHRDGALRKMLDELAGNGGQIDLLIMTHVDEDHIGGLIKGFEPPHHLRNLTRSVVFNSGQLIHEHFKLADVSQNVLRGNFSGSSQTSIKQGITFEKLITDAGIWKRELFLQSMEHDLKNVKIRFLSPDEAGIKRLLRKWEKEQTSPFTSKRNTDYKQTYEQLLNNDAFIEDNSIHNNSSISCIIEFQSKIILLLGDAPPSKISDGLRSLNYSKSNPITADLVKLSHHGSKANTSPELLDLINCDHYVVSTDGSRHGLPNKLTFARIHHHNPNATIYFNYPEIIKTIYTQQEIEKLEGKLKGLNGDFCLG
ncbi:hypothetical protein [Pseudomonas sp. HY7a-MNA-CIBAN-0227]|uniref:ComEC/Rec2 family competence protein n=1 Tax=Pseudomonas sp. HY7a-MNA-CIBAN-0227 TaxID=3140474 RepID=UPI00332542E3